MEEEVGGVWIGEGVRRHLGGLLDKREGTLGDWRGCEARERGAEFGRRV